VGTLLGSHAHKAKNPEPKKSKEGKGNEDRRGRQGGLKKERTKKDSTGGYYNGPVTEGTIATEGKRGSNNCQS